MIDCNGVTHQGITASINMGSQKHSSGRWHDSPSGHSFMVGAHTKRMIAKHMMSKLCHECEDCGKVCNSTNLPMAEENRPTHSCPRNWKRHSKSMEVAAAVISTQEFFHTTKEMGEQCTSFIITTISDKDTTAWANVQTSLDQVLAKEKVAHTAKGEEVWDEKDCPWWPMDNSKCKHIKTDHGKLPTNVLPPRIWLAGPNNKKGIRKECVPFLWLQDQQEANKEDYGRTIEMKLWHCTP